MVAQVSIPLRVLDQSDLIAGWGPLDAQLCVLLLLQSLDRLQP